MRNWSGLACGAALSLAVTLGSFGLTSRQATISGLGQGKDSDKDPETATVKKLLETYVNAEWQAFQKGDKKAYSDLLREDFIAVEDDNLGTRNKRVAASEVERALVNKYYLFAMNVLPLGQNVAFVTYEVTVEFPPKAQVRMKRVLVSELWLKQNGQWKARYYQETHVR
jgi:hypothetical protein